MVLHHGYPCIMAIYNNNNKQTKRKTNNEKDDIMTCNRLRHDRLVAAHEKLIISSVGVRMIKSIVLRKIKW